MLLVRVTMSSSSLKKASIPRALIASSIVHALEKNCEREEREDGFETRSYQYSCDFRGFPFCAVALGGC